MIESERHVIRWWKIHAKSIMCVMWELKFAKRVVSSPFLTRGKVLSVQEQSVFCRVKSTRKEEEEEEEKSGQIQLWRCCHWHKVILAPSARADTTKATWMDGNLVRLVSYYLLSFSSLPVDSIETGAIAVSCHELLFVFESKTLWDYRDWNVEPPFSRVACLITWSQGLSWHSWTYGLTLIANESAQT